MGSHLGVGRGGTGGTGKNWRNRWRKEPRVLLAWVRWGGQFPRLRRAGRWALCLVGHKAGWTGEKEEAKTVIAGAQRLREQGTAEGHRNQNMPEKCGISLGRQNQDL